MKLSETRPMSQILMIVKSRNGVPEGHCLGFSELVII